MNKKVILSAATVGVMSLAGLANWSMVQAQGPADQSSLIQKIAEHFGLNQDEVQTVFDEYRQEEHTQRQAEMQSRREEQLSQAVSDGKITEDQKTAILAKEAEMQQQMANLQDLSMDERRSQMESLHDEMKTWFESQGIDQSVIGRGDFGRRNGESWEPRGAGFGSQFSSSETSN